MKRKVTFLRLLRHKARHILHYVRMEFSLFDKTERTTPLSDAEIKELSHIEHLCKKGKFNLFRILGVSAVVICLALVWVHLIFLLFTLFCVVFFLYAYVADDNISKMIKTKYNNWKENRENFKSMVDYRINNPSN